MVYKILVIKTQGRKQPVRYNNRWEVNMKTNLRDTKCDDMKLVKLVHDKA
jgi:hypothetical protein